jgi:membrane associated rhomboid family serine protease
MVVIVGRRVPPVVAALIALTMAMTVGAAIDRQLGGDLFHRLALVPSAVWAGEVWRLASWPFVDAGPVSLLFECVILFGFAPDLHERWGRRRFVRFVAAAVAVAGVGTCLIALVVPTVWWVPQYAGIALGEGIVIAWAMQFPELPVQIYGVIVVRGREVVTVLLGLTCAIGVFGGLARVLPALLLGGFALLYVVRPRWPRWPRGPGSRRRRRRTSGLGVIDGDRHGGPFYPS